MLMWNNTFQKGALQWVLKLSLPQEIAFSTIIESWLIVEDAKMSNDGAPYVPLWGFEANSKWICLPPCLAFNYVKTYSSCPFNSSLSVTNCHGIKIKKKLCFPLVTVDLIRGVKSGLKVKTSSTQWVWSYLWLLLFLKADQKFNFCLHPKKCPTKVQNRA